MSKKTLVLGASLKTERYSNRAVVKLVDNQHETVAFGLRKGEIAGVVVDTELQQYKNLDSVTLYLNRKRQKEYYYYIIGLKPKRVIFNPGTENPELYALLEAENIEVEVACTLVLLSINQY